jgi:hypothetical protein
MKFEIKRGREKETKGKMTMALKGSILAEQVSETKSIQHSAKTQPTRRYEVQFQDDGRQHSDTNDLAQAEYYARSLGNWNLAAQVYDRVTQRIIFRAQAYAEKGNSSARSGLLAAGDCTCPGASVAG